MITGCEFKLLIGMLLSFQLKLNSKIMWGEKKELNLRKELPQCKKEEHLHLDSIETSRGAETEKSMSEAL